MGKKITEKKTQETAHTPIGAVPRWNLDAIYPSINCDEYKQAVADYQSGMDILDGLLGKAEKGDFSVWLAAYIKADNDVTAGAGTLNAYAYAVYSIDTTNTAFLSNISRIEEMGLRAEKQDIAFRLLLAAHLDDLPEFYRRYPEYRTYQYLLQEAVDGTAHQMSPAEEDLASDLQRTGGDAWSRLHEQIISTLNDGETGKTFNTLRNDAYSPQAGLRKKSYEKEISLLEQNEIAIAAALNNLKGETVTLNKRRHWDAAIDRALTASRMSRKTLDALIGAVEDSLPLWRNYLQTKASLLRGTGATASVYAGMPETPGIAFYDLFAPLAAFPEQADEGSLLNRKWTFNEARDYIIERYSNFSTSMGQFAERAFTGGWIDAEVRRGKVGGAYDQDFAKGHQSRILSNFTGAFSDVVTLAHELGHAYHFNCMKGKDPAFFNYPMTLAETASTFAETIVKQDIISRSTGFDKMRIIELDLQDVCQVLVDILCRYYFEQSVFEEREEGELSASDFCRLMRTAQERSYGCGLDDERHEYMWAVKSHYYSTDLDFYNFPYAFGQLFAAGLYARYLKEGNRFPDIYAALLADTGGMSCEDLCSRAGFDITTKAFWKSGIAMYEKEAGELKKYAGSL
jgi:oligoendopeptidase F